MVIGTCIYIYLHNWLQQITVLSIFTICDTISIQLSYTVCFSILQLMSVMKCVALNYEALARIIPSLNMCKSATRSIYIAYDLNMTTTITNSRSNAITCETSFHCGDHLCQIREEYILNCTSSRGETLKYAIFQQFYCKVMAKWSWIYRSRSKAIALGARTLHVPGA